jgi:AcrR family transcriptional regulator
MSGTSPRRYDSSRRQARAAESRRRVVQAAHGLFVSQGYAATTVAAVAAAAEVSVPTVYEGFGSKGELLRRAIDVALAGDDAQVAVADRPTATWVYEADTAEELLGRYAVMMGEVAERAGPIYDVLVRAADTDAELARLVETFEAQRLTAATRLAEAVRDRGGLPAGRDVDAARDVVWLCNAPELHTMLVGRRGWSNERYVDWARHALVQMVTTPPPAGRAPVPPPPPPPPPPPR